MAHALLCLSARRPGLRCWGHPSVNPDLKREGEGLALGLSRGAASTASRQSFPHPAAALAAGNKSGCWGGPLSVWSNIWISSQPGAVGKSLQPAPAERRVLGISLQLRVPAGPHLLALCGDSVPQALSRCWPRAWRSRPGACCTTHEDTSQQPQQEGPSPYCRSGYGLGRDYLTPRSCFPPLFCPPCCPTQLVL